MGNKSLSLSENGGYKQVDNDHTWIVNNVVTSTYAPEINEMVLCNPTIGGFTINLPTSIGKLGKNITIKNASNSNNTIIIQAFGSETIDNNTSVNIITEYDLVRLMSDGANWITW